MSGGTRSETPAAPLLVEQPRGGVSRPTIDRDDSLPRRRQAAARVPPALEDVLLLSGLLGAKPSRVGPTHQPLIGTGTVDARNRGLVAFIVPATDEFVRRRRQGEGVLR